MLPYKKVSYSIAVSPAAASQRLAYLHNYLKNNIFSVNSYNTSSIIVYHFEENLLFIWISQVLNYNWTFSCQYPPENQNLLKCNHL